LDVQQGRTGTCQSTPVRLLRLSRTSGPESIVPSVNFYSVTNNFTFIDKVVNQFTTLDIDAGDNSPVTAVVINSLDS
jgi:hypothetical protein